MGEVEMGKFKRFVAIACVGACLGATAVAFTVPATGEVGFRGVCNHPDKSKSKNHNC